MDTNEPAPAGHKPVSQATATPAAVTAEAARATGQVRDATRPWRERMMTEGPSLPWLILAFTIVQLPAWGGGRLGLALLILAIGLTAALWATQRELLAKPAAGTAELFPPEGRQRRDLGGWQERAWRYRATRVR